MIVKKFLHSCLLIEDGNKRLLIDPTSFSFLEGIVKPDDIGPVDAILITHKHVDHYDPDAIKTFLKMKNAKIVATQEVVDDLKTAHNIHAETIKSGGNNSLNGFRIHAYNAPHGFLPVPLPENLAYVVNDVLLNPGDSFDVHNLQEAEVVAAPIAGPWVTIPQALDFIRKMKAKRVFPIHDVIIKDFMLERTYGMIKNNLDKDKIRFDPMKIGEVLEV